MQRAEDLVTESAPYLTHVLQSILEIGTEKQRAKMLAAAFRRRESTDDKILPGG